MISEKMYELGSKRSVIRELFEYGKKRAAEIGSENVFDFSLGNPSIPAPESVKEAILDLVENTDPIALHGYTSAQGDLTVRDTVAKHINGLSEKCNVTPDNIYMTSGAAASLSICLKAVIVPEDEVITFAPFFPEYRVFAEAAGAKFSVIPPNKEDFQIDFDILGKSISEKTKAVIINSPNNPSGVVYSTETISKLCKILTEKSKQYNHSIYLITDEPYRELIYSNDKLPYVPDFYDNTFVCYSYSKSLSLPGERIGYIMVSPLMEEWQKVYAAVCGAGRALGYVCASSLFQRVIARCIGDTSDISEYLENRNFLYNSLKNMGFDCVSPSGAFYLFVKSPEEDANIFCERAKKHEILIVPGDDFGCPGYVRIAYCVKRERIEKALPSFEKLINEYK